MFHRLGLIHKNQRGFTLIELMIAIVITGLITGGITGAIFQVLTGNARTSNHMTAVRQVQNAGYWVSHDGQMAQSVVITGVSGFPLTLIWTEYVASNDEHQVVYTLDNNKLQREHYTNSGLDATTMVAQHIDPTKTNCKLTAGAFNLPDTNDKFTITGGAVADNGTIIVTAGSISVNTTGGATYDSDTGSWTTPAGGGNIKVAADEANTEGIWTYTTETATAVITTDSDGNATLADGGVLILTVTATVSGFPQEQSETRVYEVMPRPDA